MQLFLETFFKFTKSFSVWLFKILRKVGKIFSSPNDPTVFGTGL